MKFNLASHALTELVSIKVLFQPTWSTKGFIAFTSGDKQIWKVDENGGNLSQLTHAYQNWYPDWSPDGVHLIFSLRDDSPIPNLTIVDSDGIFVKELDSTINGFSPKWSQDSKNTSIHKGSATNMLFIYHFSCSDSSVKDTISLAGVKWVNPYHIDWFPDSEKFIWTDDAGGIYTTYIDSNEATKIKKDCDNRYYRYMSVSPDGQKIIAERTDQYVIDDETKFVDNYLVIMNADGSGEKRISVPQ